MTNPKPQSRDLSTILDELRTELRKVVKRQQQRQRVFRVINWVVLAIMIGMIVPWLL